jgi:hypothetical protein
MVVEDFSEHCAGLISGGYFQRNGEAFVFNPPTDMEWSPIFPSLDPNWTPWDDLAEALRSGRTKEVATLIDLLRGPLHPPTYILDLVADFNQGKNKAPANRPAKVVYTRPPSLAMYALAYFERLQPVLRDMYPTQRPSAITLQARQIACAEFGAKMDDLKALISLPKSRRR